VAEIPPWKKGGEGGFINSFLAIGGGSLGLLLGEQNPLRLILAGGGLFVTAGLSACFESRQMLSLRGAKGDEAISQSWKN
jgi:hypothetical protein